MSARSTFAWVFLAEVLGPAGNNLLPIAEAFPNIEDILDPAQSYEFHRLLTPAALARAKQISLGDIERRLERCEKTGVRVLGYGDENFPPQLRETGVPPAALYVTGDVALLSNRRAIAGVGSRYITQYGRDVIKKICEPLAQRGITLVSGLALGADAEVHKAALKQDAKTVAVLGNGIDITVPSRHAELRRLIEQSGAVVSEYPPGADCQPFMFPQRNRIISGLARAVVVFEAALKSGTMITAGWALDDGRDVYAVPGSILSSQSEGTNYLIKQGAAPATCADDVLPSLDMAPLAAAPEQLQFEQKPPLDGLEKQIFESLFGGPLLLDDLAEKTGQPPTTLLPALTMLEMGGYIETMPGGRYRAL